ncbi:hypothetical protein CapIbe_018545 [Capra ibex]
MPDDLWSLLPLGKCFCFPQGVHGNFSAQLCGKRSDELVEHFQEDVVNYLTSEDGHIGKEAFSTMPSNRTKQTSILRLMDLWSNSIGPSRKPHHIILHQGNS